MSSMDRCSFNTDDSSFNCDIFSFLPHTIPSVITRNQREIHVRLTCLDVSSVDLVVGSNVGQIFAFRRRTAITNRPHFAPKIFTTAVSLVKTTRNPGLIIASSYSTIVLWSLYEAKEIWRINLYSNETTHPSDPKPCITCMEIEKDEEDYLLLYAGLSNGHVTAVNVELKDNEFQYDFKTIFIETDEGITLDHLNHKIVQLSIIPTDSLLISTCYRTIILQNCKSNRSVVQVGKNQRSTCASYGACYMESADAIFASRPSSHLLVADPSTGFGEKTFILKRLSKPPNVEAFDRVREKNVQEQPKCPFVLGRLMPVDSRRIISWNKTTFYMFTCSGELLVDERNVDIRGISVVSSSDGPRSTRSSNQFEIFILFVQMTLLRISNFIYEDDDVKSFLSTSCSSQSEIDDISHDATVASYLSSNLTSTFNTLINGLRVRSDSGEANRPLQSYMNNETMASEVISDGDEGHQTLSESVVVARRNLFKSSKFKSTYSTPSNDAVTSTVTSDTSDGRRVNEASTLQVAASKANLYVSLPEDDDGRKSLQETSVDESERLLQILRAYNIAKSNQVENEASAPLHTDTQQGQQDDPLSPSSSSPPLREVVKNNQVSGSATDVDSANDAPVPPQVPTFNGPLVLSPLPLSAEDDPRDLSAKHSNVYDKVFINWREHNPHTKQAQLDLSKVSEICAIRDESHDAVALLVNSSGRNWHIFIYPGGRKIKCPSSQSRIRSFHVSCNQITLLYQDGIIYRATDWLKKSLFSFGPKFIQMQYKRCNCFVDISCNVLDRVTWTCDQEGFAWILKSTDSAAVLARDNSSPQLRLTTIHVSPCNSAIVWAVDQFGRLFVRVGIYNERGDTDTLIGGINWILVDDLPGRVGVISASRDAIWMVSEIDGQSHLYKRLGIDPPNNYIGTEWQEYSLPADEKVRFLSVSSTDDIWIITSSMKLFQYCPHEDCLLKQVENGWLLL